VIAATNRALPDLIDSGAFRQDLYYRLNVIHVHVRPLRERPEDIPPLIEYFLGQFAETQSVPKVMPEVHAALVAYAWPGNVRQLENVLQRLVVSGGADCVTVADLPDEIRAAAPALPLPPQPRVERRRTMAGALYQQLLGGASFWSVVHQPFIEREITKRDVREVVRLGLEEARGNYRIVTRLFNVAPGDYRRLLNFLRKHGCLISYREYRV
jgi:DNA-binding NtrC family response regulator